MDRDAVFKAQEFVRTHLKDDFSLDELAWSVGYSAYHFARGYKAATGQSAMEYVREMRVLAAADEISRGTSIIDAAMEYGFETHSGFTKAFSALFGCTPRQYGEHVRKSSTKREIIMEESGLVVRPICQDDVQDLWENVYSAMTPRQIMDLKVTPAFEAEQAGRGVHLVAQLNGKVVMALPMLKPYWIPVGFLFDNNFVLTGGDADMLIGKMLEEMKRYCAMMNVSTLISPQKEGSESARAFVCLGFTEAFRSGGWSYLMMAI
jgi:AraC-like DNA-binding protein